MLDLYTADYTYVNETAREALRHSGRHRRRVPPRALSGRPAPRPARPGERADADVAREPHVAGAARQVGDGSACSARRRHRRRRTCPISSKTGEAKEGRMLTTRERMEMHRVEPAVPLVSPVHGSDRSRARQLRRDRTVAHSRERRGARHARAASTTARRSRISAELQRGAAQAPDAADPHVHANLMAYALGRRIEYYDSPIDPPHRERRGRRAATQCSDFMLGVVTSDAFRARRVPAAAADVGRSTTLTSSKP